MRGRGKDKEEKEEPVRGGVHRRSNPNGGAEEPNPSETPENPEITMDICEDWLNESHTLLRNMLVRFSEGVTPLELDALANGLKCVELVLSDEDMMALYQGAAIAMRETVKEEEAKQKK